MPLQHQVDVAGVEDRLPGGLQLFGVLRPGAGVDRLVEQGDVPARRAFGQHTVQPARLTFPRSQVDGRRAVQHDEAHALIVDVIAGRLGPLCPVVRQGELQRPVRPQKARFLAVRENVVDVFVIAAGGQLRRHGEGAAAGLGPFAPFVVVNLDLALGHQIARMDDQSRRSRLLEGRADHARRDLENVVLGVPQIDEAERRELRLGRAERQPLAPAVGGAHAIDIARVRLQPVEARLMIEGAAVLILDRRRGPGHGPGGEAQQGAVDLLGDLGLGGGLARVGAPGDGGAARSIGGRTQHDAVGPALGRPAAVRRVQRRRQRIGVRRRDDLGHGGRGGQQDGCGQTSDGQLHDDVSPNRYGRGRGLTAQCDGSPGLL